VKASYYDLNTGLFTGREISASGDVVPHAERNSRPGEGFKIGKFDRETQLVDLTTGEVVERT
jgi:hypothetical protein